MTTAVSKQVVVIHCQKVVKRNIEDCYATHCRICAQSSARKTLSLNCHMQHFVCCVHSVSSHLPSMTDTCLCELHENGCYIIMKMKLLPLTCINIEECVKLAVSEVATQMFYDKRCANCVIQLMAIPTNMTDFHSTVNWF